MISFGITEKLQISGSLPVPLGETNAMPAGRMMAMMSGNPDVESLLGWRFQTRPIGEGARLESTVYIGALVPLDSTRAGIATSPAGLVSLASGYASRSHYFWAGATHVHHAESDGDRLGSVTSFSLVYGYRPPAWRKDYPKPDLRFFIEAAGDLTGTSRHDGETMDDTGGRVALVGPTLLLLLQGVRDRRRHAVSGLPEEPFPAAGRTLPFRTQLHVLLLAFEGRGSPTMNRILGTAAALAILLLLPSVASAELRRVQLNVLGMD